MSLTAVKELQNIVGPSLNEEFLINCIKKKTKWNNVELNEVIIDTNAGRKGDAYLSTLIRFTIKATSKNGESGDKEICLPVITKYVPKNEARRKTFRSKDFFKNECNFYKVVWERFLQFLESKPIKDVDDLASILPFYLGSVLDGDLNTFISLEDASYVGFQSVDRSQAIDFDTTILILNCFAKFHGIGYAFRDQHKEAYQEIASSLQETYFHEKYRNWYSNFQHNLMKTVRDCVEKQLPEKYLNAFDKVAFNKDLFEIVSELCARQTSLTAITHGDAWLPNFLVKYDKNNKKPIQPLMIDFQLTRSSSLALDLGFFFNTCVDREMYLKHEDRILQIYCDTFNSTVKSLGSCKELKPTELKFELKDVGIFSLAMGMEALVMSLLDDSQVADIDALQGTEAVPLEDVWILEEFKDADKIKRIADVVKQAIDESYI